MSNKTLFRRNENTTITYVEGDRKISLEIKINIAKKYV